MILIVGILIIACLTIIGVALGKRIKHIRDIDHKFEQIKAAGCTMQHMSY